MVTVSEPLSNHLDAPTQPSANGERALPSVTVIVPVFNEERTLDELLRRLVGASRGAWEILVVNDGSTDASGEILKKYLSTDYADYADKNLCNLRNLRIQVFQHPTNRGKGAAVRTALEHATGDVVVIQDADLEYNPADLPALLEPFRDPDVQAVYGTRYGPRALWRAAGREAPGYQPWTKFRLAVSLLNGLVWLLYGRRLHDEATCYKVVRRALLTELQLRSNRFELCAEITGKLCQRGIRIVERPISYHPRDYGEGKKIGLSAFIRCVKELVLWRLASTPPSRRGDGTCVRNQIHSLIHSRGRWVGPCALLLCLVAGIWGAKNGVSGRATPVALVQPALRVSAASLNFGEAWESNRFHWQIEFENSGDQPIRIEEFDTSCDCAKIDVKRLEIPGQEKRVVSAMLDLTSKKPAVRTGNSWPVRFPVRVEWKDVDGTNRTAGWLIEGRVNALVELQPPFIWFGDDLLRGRSGEPRKVLIRPLVPLNEVHLRAPPEGFNAALTRTAKGYELSVTPTEKLPAGFFTRELTLELTDRQDHRLPEQTATVFGTINEKVVSLPEHVQLGPVREGESVEGTITVSGRTSTAFEVTKVDTPPGTAVVTQGPDGSVWRIRFRQQVDQAGNKSVVIGIHVRLVDGDSFVVPVTVRWFAVKASRQY